MSLHARHNFSVHLFEGRSGVWQKEPARNVFNQPNLTDLAIVTSAY